MQVVQSKVKNRRWENILVAIQGYNITKDSAFMRCNKVFSLDPSKITERMGDIIEEQ